MRRQKIRGGDRAVAERRARSGGNKHAARGQAANRQNGRSQGRQGRSQQLSSRSAATKRAVGPTGTRRDRWKNGLMLNDHGVPLGNLRNALYTFRHAPEWKAVLAYDEFAAQVITKRPPPWGGPPVERWADQHDVRACAWMQEQDIAVALGVVGHAIQTVAREFPFHPVRDYLNTLKWDGTPRLAPWLTPTSVRRTLRMSGRWALASSPRPLPVYSTRDAKSTPCQSSKGPRGF